MKFLGSLLVVVTRPPMPRGASELANAGEAPSFRKRDQHPRLTFLFGIGSKENTLDVIEAPILPFSTCASVMLTS